MGSQQFSWAVILCSFKGGQGDASIEKFVRQAFTPGAGGLVEYWRDISLGSVDISSSKVFGWVELGITRLEAGGKGRTALVNEARKAAKNAGIDVETGFFSQIAIFTHDWSRDDIDRNGPNRYDYWLDGSSDGKTVSAPPHGHSGSFLAHEMAHVHGLSHDYAADLKTAYGDPFCIMSAMNVKSFSHSTISKPFGPSLCLPHLIQKGWIDISRVYRDDGNWMTQSSGITLPLATVNDLSARANLGIKLAYSSNRGIWDYYLEFVRPISWNQGFNDSYLLVRRMFASGEGETSALLGSIKIPSEIKVSVDFVEPLGNVLFQVEQFDTDGRIVKVTAQKLKLRPAVSAISTVPGGTSLFVIGLDAQVWSQYFDPRQENPVWSGWFPLSGRASSLSAISTVPGGTSLFVIGLDGRVWSQYFDPRQESPVWSGWFPLGDNVFPQASTVSAISTVPGGTSLFVIGLDGQVWSQYFDPRQENPVWSGWFPLGGQASSLSAISTVPGGTSLFVIGLDGRVWSQYFDPRQESPVWSGWFPLGDNVFPQASTVSAISTVPGGISLFVIGLDGQVWSQYFDPRQENPVWSGWFPLGGQASSLSAISTVPGGTSLFVIGLDGRVWSQYFDPRQENPVWSGWFPLGDNVFPQTSTVSAISTVPGGTSLFVIGLDGRVWSQYFDPRQENPVWSGWFPLGDNVFPYDAVV
ncbi:MAG: hypothetical protein KME15_28320 [Drouetiella hepatica Uher 2000/2452]|jgi:hypothetical protein|uniref:PLL-like beta propeller domain-containing protein n=1 Tax=Drouetiella hepatica Uher 2000/2452 TaxID=904376 RepID=A0A951QJW0_9CYAN|nr:hypothetical protein [Drouetiella hepatica Uher 2000/2452]